MFLGAGLIACLGIAAEIPRLDPTLQDWRVAATLVSISLVLLFLSRIPQEPPLLRDLKGVERRLALGKLLTQQAREKADCLLFGMTLSDLMQPVVQDVLRSQDALESAQNELNRGLEVLKSAVGSLVNTGTAGTQQLQRCFLGAQRTDGMISIRSYRER